MYDKINDMAKPIKIAVPEISSIVNWDIFSMCDLLEPKSFKWLIKSFLSYKSNQNVNTV